MGELDGDGGWESGCGDGIEGGEAEIAGDIGLLPGGDVLAEVIEGGEVAAGVEFVADADDVVEGLAGDEAGREFPGVGGSLHPMAQTALAGEIEERLPEHKE